MHSVKGAKTLYNKKPLLIRIWQHKVIYLLLLPIVIHVVIFSYIPMYGLTLAFRDFRIGDPLFPVGEAARWVGLRNFQDFFSSIYAFRTIRNTILNSVFSLIFAFWVPIVFALLLNEIRHIKYKRTVQTISYLPYFISSAIIAGLAVTFLNERSGMVNNIIEFFGGQRVEWLMIPEAFRPIHITIGSWQTFGWGSILYLAAIAGIDQNLYEAAKIDGANRLQQAWHITLPGISPTIFILLIFTIGNMMGGDVERILLMYNPSVYSTADVLGTYIYRQGMEMSRFSLSTAVGLFASTVNFALLILANWSSRRITGNSVW